MRKLPPGEKKRRRAEYAKRYYTDPANRSRRNAAARERLLTDPAGTREKRKMAQQRYIERNPEKYRENTRRQNWRRKGASTPTRARPARCELCNHLPAENGNGAVLNLDHDHATGEFRGRLCRRCNVALGLLRDSAELCISAANYLNTAGLI